MDNPIRNAAFLLASNILGLGAAHALADPPKLVSMTLIAEKDALIPGQTLEIGLRFEIAPEWHLYWPGQNDSGFPPTIEVTAPKGYAVGEPRWPNPTRHPAPGELLDHVLEKEALVVVPLTVPADAVTGTKVTLEAASSWLVCKNACLPGDGTSSITLPVATAAKPGSKVGLFVAARASRPGPIDPASGISCEVRRGRLQVLAPGATVLRFFPAADSAPFKDLLKDGESKRGRLSIALEDPGPDARIRGVLEVVTAAPPERSMFYSVEMPADPAAAKPAESSQFQSSDTGETRR